MSRINLSVLSFAAMILVADNSVFAQNNNTAVPVVNNRQLSSIGDAAAFESQEKYALPWATVASSNISSKKRVWRDIDASEKGNQVFASVSKDELRNSLADILIEGVIKGEIKAYNAADDRFTFVMTKEDVITLLTTGTDTQIILNPATGATITRYLNHNFNPDAITKFRVKEDWLFLKNENKMVVRILGIAPLKAAMGADGTITDQPVFWIYYPDSRNYLAQHKVFNGNKELDQNWDELFVNRQFSGSINSVRDYGASFQDR